MGRKRSDGGEYVEAFDLRTVLGVFDQVDGPIVTSGDVAETLDCSRETARRKLAELHDRGDVERRTTAGRVVWWLAADREPRTPPGVETAADRVGGFGLFAAEGGEAFGEAIEESRAEFDDDYEERHDDLFGH